ncbi:hypothetical protein WJX84_001033, partial [Apatococcus fuscideae]
GEPGLLEYRLQNGASLAARMGVDAPHSTTAALQSPHPRMRAAEKKCWVCTGPIWNQPLGLALVKGHTNHEELMGLLTPRTEAC